MAPAGAAALRALTALAALLDGTGMAFVKAPEGNRNIYVMNGDGSGVDDRLLGGTAIDQLFGEGGTDIDDGGPAFDRCVDRTASNNTFVNCEFAFELNLRPVPRLRTGDSWCRISHQASPVRW